jgi:hypothetical protein
MIYGLKIGDEFRTFVDPQTRFAPSYPINDKRIFVLLVEEWLQSCEGHVGIPGKSRPWSLWKGTTEETLDEMIIELHGDDPYNLWNLRNWLSEGCLTLQIKVSY